MFEHSSIPALRRNIHLSICKHGISTLTFDPSHASNVYSRAEKSTISLNSLAILAILLLANYTGIL